MNTVCSTIYTSALFLVSPPRKLCCCCCYFGYLSIWRLSLLLRLAFSVCSSIFLLLFPLHIRTSILYFPPAPLQSFPLFPQNVLQQTHLESQSQRLWLKGYKENANVIFNIWFLS